MCNHLQLSSGLNGPEFINDPQQVEAELKAWPVETSRFQRVNLTEEDKEPGLPITFRMTASRAEIRTSVLSIFSCKL